MQCIVRGFFNRIKWDDSGQLMVAMHCAATGNYKLRCGQQAIGNNRWQDGRCSCVWVESMSLMI